MRKLKKLLSYRNESQQEHDEITYTMQLNHYKKKPLHRCRQQGFVEKTESAKLLNQWFPRWGVRPTGGSGENFVGPGDFSLHYQIFFLLLIWTGTKEFKKMFRLLLINYHLFWNFHFDYVYLYVGGARDFWYEKSWAWVKKVGKHCAKHLIENTESSDFSAKSNRDTSAYQLHSFYLGLLRYINSNNIAILMMIIIGHLLKWMSPIKHWSLHHIKITKSGYNEKDQCLRSGTIPNKWGWPDSPPTNGGDQIHPNLRAIWLMPTIQCDRQRASSLFRPTIIHSSSTYFYMSTLASLTSWSLICQFTFAIGLLYPDIWLESASAALIFNLKCRIVKLKLNYRERKKLYSLNWLCTD